MRRRKLRGDFPARSHVFWPLCGHSERSEKPSALRSLLPSAPCFARVSRFRGPIPAANYKV